MTKRRVYQVDAFTTEPFTGNPAGVVLDADGLSEAQMQAIAREMGNSETAFVFSPTGSDHDVYVRFFTPTTEVPSCGHATIAAHYVRARALNLDSGRLRHRIGIGVLPIDIVREGDNIQIVMTQGPFHIGAPLPESIEAPLREALGIDPVHLDTRCPIQIASTGHSKVMVGLRKRRDLNLLKPDFRGLADISRRLDCNGYFVFTLDTDDPKILSHARMFAPAIGVPEDPVTGNGNGPLGGYLVHHGLVEPLKGKVRFHGRQGEALGRPGTVEVMVDVENGEPDTIRVAGRAVTVFETTLDL